MDLNEMEELWKKHDKKLEHSIQLNKALLKRLNFDKAVDEFKQFISMSVMGRNLALLYFVISISSSLSVLSDLRYSIPGFIGALLMLWSFLYHLKPTSQARKLDFNTMPVVDLQKTINTFKIRSLSAARYDFAVVTVWLLTLRPIREKLRNHDVYADPQAITNYLLVSIAILAVAFLLTKIIFERYFLKKLNMAEAQLQEILEFEKQTG